MEITFLGTGSAMPTGERFQTGILIESGDDRLLVDCGSGALHGLARTDAGYEGVGSVLLTHHHLDHVSDLMALLKARWLAGEESLAVAGPAGTADLLDGLLDVHDYLQDRVELSVEEIGAGSFSFASFDVEAVETIHSMPCLAYRFEGEDGDFVFSGDTEASEAIADFADGAAVLAHDCSFPDEVDVSNHPTPSQLGAVFADREIGTVYLTHLYPHTDGNHREMLDSIGEHYDGEVHFAHDGLTVEV